VTETPPSLSKVTTSTKIERKKYCRDSKISVQNVITASKRKITKIGTETAGNRTFV
jgi:hypothetical protein